MSSHLCLAKVWLQRLVFGGLLAGALGYAQAASFTLSGSFSRDDDVALFDLVLGSGGLLDVRSLGYAGGIDTNGVARLAGGFDTMAFLYNGSGTLIAQSDDGIGVPTDPVTGLASDAAFAISLGAGSYRLALTQYDNFALGDFSAGFSRAGTGNFTPQLSMTCSANAFCDSIGAARTDGWVIAINGVTTVTPVPEPATLALMLTGGACVSGWARRRGGKSQKSA